MLGLGPKTGLVLVQLWDPKAEKGVKDSLVCFHSYLTKGPGFETRCHYLPNHSIRFFWPIRNRDHQVASLSSFFVHPTTTRFLWQLHLDNETFSCISNELLLRSSPFSLSSHSSLFSRYTSMINLQRSVVGASVTKMTPKTGIWTHARANICVWLILKATL